MRKALVPLGVVLLVDVIRTWLPTIITVFGQAASTPAELMGAFALLWFVLAFAAPPVARWRRFALVAGVVLAACRFGLVFVGGQTLLYTASVGLLAGLCWLVAVAMRGASPRAVAVGLAAAAVEHAFIWRGEVGWVLAAATAAGFVGLLLFSKQGDGPEDAPVGGWFFVGPIAFLALQIGLSSAVVTTGVSYAIGGTVAVSGGAAAAAGAVALTSLAVLSFVYLMLRPPPALISAVALVAGATAFTLAPGWTYVMVVPVTAAALGGCAGVVFTGPPTSELRRGFRTAAGMLVFSVAAFAYYASYDIGYPNMWVPPVIALVVAVAAVRRRGPVPAFSFPRLSLEIVAALVVALVAAGAWWQTPEYRGYYPGEVRVVAYNIRMAYGLDGRFSADRLAAVIRAEQPQVVLLSEVDRAWLLNGGYDDLQVLARAVGMRYVFAPAGDSVWGDAILTNQRVLSSRTERLPSYGAPTGAQVLAADLDINGSRVTVVSTHLQPPPGRPPLEQARDVARFAASFNKPGHTVIVGGDFNTEPGEEPFEAIVAAGFTDALADRRPVLTNPADAPDQQIDHIFVFGGQAKNLSVPRSTASDHLAVAVTISLPEPT